MKVARIYMRVSTEAQNLERQEGIAPSVPDMLLKLALQMAHDDYQDRRERQRQGIVLAKAAGRYAGRKTDTCTHAPASWPCAKAAKTSRKRQGWQV